MYLFFDTETTGRPLNNQYNEPPSNLTVWGAARVVQIAWIECDENGKKTAAHNHIIKPDGFTIPAEVIKIHRISNEKANEKGIPIKQALDEFREALKRNRYLIAHNIQFDQNVVGSEFIRAGEEDPIEDIEKVCTMRLTTDFCKLKGWGGKYKWPSMEELHVKLFGTKFEEAHDALIDTEAVVRCFFRLQEIGVLGFKTGEESKADFSKTDSAAIPSEELFKPLVNFGVHTFNSILRGASSVSDYVARAKELGHPAMAITDRSNVSASFEFFQKCKAAGIKPILGCEFNLNNKIGAFDDANEEGESHIQKVIVKNREGFVSLNKLLFLSHTKGLRNGESRITTDWLIQNKEGLMVSTSGHDGLIGDFIVKGRREEAEAQVERLKLAFGDDLFIEVKFNEMDEQKRLNEFLLIMANKHDIMVIMDNDVHYAMPDGASLQDTVYCIGQNGMPLKRARLFERRRLFYPNRKNYIDFNKRFEFFYPENVVESFFENSLALAERCDFDFEIGVEKYPRYEPTPDVIDYFHTNSPEEIIYKLAPAKLNQKIRDRENREGKKMDADERKRYFDRLSYELDVIKDKKMLDYFLVNWEIIREYRKRGYEIGPGRGSAAGSLLSWALDITKIDPIRFGLYFERFLNPTRNCLTEDAVVLMKDGSLKRICDVQVGDAVETESGKGELVQVHVREVTAEDEVFELEMENGAILRLTGDHVMPVLRGGRRVDVCVAELQEGDEMWVS